MKKFYAKYENLIMAAMFILILMAAVIIRYDLYYDLNDDVMMKDILAGIYTGSPESRNIQMLYPLSAIISVFYRIIPAVPWYALFLCFCQFFSLFLIAFRSLRFANKTLSKAVFLLFQMIVIITTMLEHLVFVQYTITSMMPAAAAVFYFLTAEKTDSVKEILFSSIPVLILIFVSFTLRPWMLLLLMPLFCAAGLIKWGQEKVVYTKQNFTRYFALFGLVVVMLLIGQAADWLAHSSAEWRSFTKFFNNRTELYDFQEIPPYDANANFYRGIGLTEGDVNLLFNYNFGLSDTIDENTMGEIAVYASQLKKDEVPFRERFIKQFRLYVYNLTHIGEYADFPYNALVICGYVALFGLGIIYSRLSRMFIIIFLLAFVRSSLWMFILMGERNPPRITHSLYFFEMVILLALFLTEMAKIIKEDDKKHIILNDAQKKVFRFINRTYPPALMVIALVVGSGNITGMIKKTDAEFAKREDINRTWIAMQEYCHRHAGNFYFIDVYSTVNYSEKLFAKNLSRPANYEIMGGWVNKSPLYQKKLDNAFTPGMSMFTALVTLDNVYFINGNVRDIDWLSGYYNEQGVFIDLERVDVIADELEVYKLR
ncbi:MAG: hypothetical protein FWC09_08715 [Lachnospiraceae bacterium]|nr:hypothetical protein [Lachnospiraceae bacterium]